jgi:hypothetical protein
MPGFDITPADPLGTLNAWRQDLARTSILEDSAQQQRMNTEGMRRQAADDQAWRAKLDSLAKVGDTAKRLEAFGTAALESGRTSDAQHALSLLSQMDNRESLRIRREADAEAKQTQSQLNQLKLAGQAYAGAKDELTYNAAHDLFKQVTGEESPLKNIPYSPKVVDFVTASLRKQMSDLEVRDRESLIASREARAATQGAVVKLRERATAVAEAAEARKNAADTKAGGKMPALSGPERQQTMDVLKGEFPNLDEAQRRIVANQIGGLAKQELLAGNAKGRTWDQLVRQALANNPDVVQRSKTMFGGTKVTAAGGLPLPQDRAALREGMVYRTAKGLAKYVGNGQFELVKEE